MLGALTKPRGWPIQFNEIKLAIAREIENLCIAAADCCGRRLECDGFQRAEIGLYRLFFLDENFVDRTEIRFVVPSAGLFGEDSR